MVDLAKIRKKAKKALGVAESSSLPVVESSSEPSPAPAPPAASSTGRLEDLKTSKLERFKEQAGKRRETVKTEQVEQAAGTQLELLTFLIASEHYAPLRQRIGMRYSLGPLTLDETIEYIEHRIRVAGGTRNPFSREAMQEIHSVSGGIPRLINTLATTALLDAFGEDAETIDPARVTSAAREHHMETAHG